MIAAVVALAAAQTAVRGWLPLADGSRLPVTRMLRAVPLNGWSYGWSDVPRPRGPVLIRVDRTRRVVTVFVGGVEVGVAAAEVGPPSFPTPRGMFRVLAKARVHSSSVYDASMPYTLRLTGDGVSIHADDVHAGGATHGCVGVPDGFARRLFDLASVGDRVSID